MPSRLEVGKIINTHGLRGEVKVVSWTDAPEDFENIKKVFAGERELNISSVRYQKNNLIIKFKELDRIEDAELLKNTILEADRSELPKLPEGIYYVADLIGCKIKTEDGECVGVLDDVFRAGAGNVYTVKRKGANDLLIPANDDTIINTDLDSKCITVRIPDGLED